MGGMRGIATPCWWGVGQTAPKRFTSLTFRYPWFSALYCVLHAVKDVRKGDGASMLRSPRMRNFSDRERFLNRYCILMIVKAVSLVT